ncbi:MAG: endonuclease domain-containing protein [Vulcanimicrobiaceae bacterium]
MQGGTCAICRTPWNECRKSHGLHNDGTFLQHLEVDHDHETGKVRGLLCGDCNIAIGKLYDDVDSCRRAADYLRRAREA